MANNWSKLLAGKKNKNNEELSQLTNSWSQQQQQ